MRGGEVMEDKMTLMKALGMSIESVEEGKVVMKMEVTENVHQPFGYLHGGASVALAESVASVGTFSMIDQENQLAFGLEINANHLRSVRDGFVTAVGTAVHTGKTTMVWDIKIYDEDEHLICISRCTVAIKDKRK
ncbi:esterase [Gottfriedia solisilvae]|uniref:Esterase n=2 Tax=Gottfriedia solisilvae TaxID=1516104 RepID=A0A8J3AK08_9BACI|nr:hotdog fold thioesterase [Gottfriedia solisilvae]GGI15883.1 esterase [Gottfriedia solisilvae]